VDDDILSQGDDREPRQFPQFPRRLGMIAALVLAVAAGGVYLVLPHHRQAASATAPASAPAPASATAPAGAPAPVAIASVGVGPSEIKISAIPGSTGRDGAVILAQPWDASLRLPATGTRPSWFSPATGRSELISGPPADSAGYQFTRLGGGWAVQADSGGKLAADCGNCAGPSLPVWYLADNARAATRVGTAALVAPAATADALWLTSYPAGADVATAAGTAREVGPSGALLRPPVTLPTGYKIVQGTDRGLLLTLASPRPGTTVDRLWNPGSGPTSASAGQSFDQMIAVSPTEIAWTSGCSPTCRVEVLNLADGQRAMLRLPAGSSPAGGVFSPSSGYLALELSSQYDDAPAVQLEVASISTGQLTRVPGTGVSSGALAGFGWPSGSNSLVAEFNFESATQLTSWRPGATELDLAIVKPGPTQAALILG
jgi:hypothetical protein